jgi:cysteine synthase A
MIEMKNVYENVLGLIGNTPIVKLKRLSRNFVSEVWLKLEFFNPSGSVKDRIVLKIIEEAEKRGDLRPGYEIVEATSGNTGLSVMMIANVKGYPVTLFMPKDLICGQRKMLELAGAKLKFTPGPETEMRRALRKAVEMSKKPGVFMIGQHINEDNPLAHELTTAEEIWEQTEGKIDYFVAGIGTGGTITGVGRGLKKHNPQIKIVGVEPEEAALFSKGKRGKHHIEGIGDGMHPKVLDLQVVDKIMTVSSKEAFDMTLKLLREEGIAGGISTGCNVYAALKLAQELKEPKLIVTVAPDSMIKYVNHLHQYLTGEWKFPEE